jgi:hypothetical protein
MPLIKVREIKPSWFSPYLRPAAGLSAVAASVSFAIADVRHGAYLAMAFFLVCCFVFIVWSSLDRSCWATFERYCAERQSQEQRLGRTSRNLTSSEANLGIAKHLPGG